MSTPCISLIAGLIWFQDGLSLLLCHELQSSMDGKSQRIKSKDICGIWPKSVEIMLWADVLHNPEIPQEGFRNMLKTHLFMSSY